MIIRRAAPEDLDRVALIEHASSPHPWSREALASELCHRHARVWVACDATGVVGFACLRVLVPEAELMLTAVHPTARRRGLARALLVTAFGSASAEGVERIGLEVRSANAGARALYTGLGFVEVGQRRRYYADDGDDAVLMDLGLLSLGAP